MLNYRVGSVNALELCGKLSGVYDNAKYAAYRGGSPASRGLIVSLSKDIHTYEEMVQRAAEAALAVTFARPAEWCSPTFRLVRPGPPIPYVLSRWLRRMNGLANV